MKKTGSLKRLLPSLIALLLLCLALIAVPVARAEPVEGTTFAAPIVWEMTTNISAVGYNYTTQIVILYSPCKPLEQLLDDLKHDPNSISDLRQVLNDKMACDRSYKINVLQLIKKNCKAVSKVNTIGLRPDSYNNFAYNLSVYRRQKRQLPLIGTGFAVGVVSYGVMTIKNWWESSKNAENIHQLDMELGRDVSLMKTHNELSEKAERMLLGALNNTWREINLFRKAFENAANSARILSASTSKINNIAYHLESLLDGIKEKKVTTAYARLFPDSPLFNETPTTYWTPRECEFMEPNVFVLKFNIPKINNDIKIMKADPFNFLSINKEGQVCLSVFQGSKFVFWNQKTNCTRDIIDAPEHKNSILLVQSGNENCASHSNRTQTWSATRCGQTFSRDQTIQQKMDEKDVYLYCYRHQLCLLGKAESECPNAVLKFSKCQTFFVDDSVFPVRLDTIKFEQHFGYSVSDLINNRTFTPDRRHLALVDDRTKIIHTEESVNENLKWYQLTQNQVMMGLGSILTAICILVGILFLCRYPPSCRLMRQFRRSGRLGSGTENLNCCINLQDGGYLHKKRMPTRMQIAVKIEPNPIITWF